MTAYQRVSLICIRVLRRVFSNTPLVRLPITAWLYKKLFHSMFQQREVVADYFGLRLAVPTRDVSISPGIIGGYYEKHELQVFQALSGRALRVLDVGGNIGLYACVAGKAIPAGAVCYAFEPVADNVASLRKNLQANDIDNVQVVESAVGDREGELTLHVSQTHAGTHSASPEVNRDSVATRVPVLTLDAFCERLGITDEIDLLKIDVEGYDGHVVRGARAVIERSRPTVFIEFIPRLLSSCEFDATELHALLFSHYRFVFAVNETLGELREITGTRDPAQTEYFDTNLILTDDPVTAGRIQEAFHA